jgi:hypothetical protein
VIPRGWRIHRLLMCAIKAVGPSPARNHPPRSRIDSSTRATGRVRVSGNQTATLPLVVTVADFALTAPAPSVTIVAGQSATFAVEVTAISGFDQPVSLECAGAPPSGSCTVSPAFVNPDGQGKVSAAVTVSTSAWAGAIQPGSQDGPSSILIGNLLGGWLIFCSMLGWLTKHFPRMRMEMDSVLLRCGATVLALMFAMSCGGGVQGTVRAKTGTPPGSYTIKVTGTFQNLSRSATLTLKVN